MDVNKIKSVLNEKVQRGNWELAEAEKGRSKITYIGNLDSKKVFIKNDSASFALLRLSELGIAPKVIYSSSDKNFPLLVQEFVSARHPTKDEINENYEEYAKLFGIFHNDAELTRLVTKSYYTYNNVVESVIEWMYEWAYEINDLEDEILGYMETLTKIKPQNVSDKMTPIHADPNISNFMVTNRKIYIVDWDDIRFLDPLRDLGQFCYEYIDKAKWNEFFSVTGIKLTEVRLKRTYWWVAIMKVIIAYWFCLYPKEKEVHVKLLKESQSIFEEFLSQKSQYNQFAS